MTEKRSKAYSLLSYLVLVFLKLGISITSVTHGEHLTREGSDMAKKSNFDNKSKFVELRAQGITYSEISRQLDVSKPTLIEWAKQCEIEIGNLKAIYLDEIYSKYFIAKMMRIELFGKTLEAIQNELSKRDLADVCTEKLLEMLLKFSSRLRDEEVALSFRGDIFDKGLAEMNVGSWEA